MFPKWYFVVNFFPLYSEHSLHLHLTLALTSPFPTIARELACMQTIPTINIIISTETLLSALWWSFNFSSAIVVVQVEILKPKNERRRPEQCWTTRICQLSEGEYNDLIIHNGKTWGKSCCITRLECHHEKLSHSHTYCFNRPSDVESNQFIFQRDI